MDNNTLDLNTLDLMLKSKDKELMFLVLKALFPITESYNIHVDTFISNNNINIEVTYKNQIHKFYSPFVINNADIKSLIKNQFNILIDCILCKIHNGPPWKTTPEFFTYYSNFKNCVDSIIYDTHIYTYYGNFKNCVDSIIYDTHIYGPPTHPEIDINNIPSKISYDLNISNKIHDIELFDLGIKSINFNNIITCSNMKYS
jgi:hypothetical protein